MKLFLDTAHLVDIETAVGWGILDGVTTNPTLAAKKGLAFSDLIAAIAAAVPGTVSAEVVADDRHEMVAQGKELAAIADNVIVKVPMTREGVAAGAQLVEQGHRDQCDPRLLGNTGDPCSQDRRHLRVTVLGQSRRHRQRRHDAARGDRRDLRGAGLRNRGAGRQPSPSPTRGGCGEDRRGHRDHALRGAGQTLQPSAHRHRA